MIIFTPFSVVSERYIKFYIRKCLQFYVKYDKKYFFFRRVRPSGRESLIRSFCFVIIFTPFSVERYIKFYIRKCLQFYVKYDKK